MLLKDKIEELRNRIQTRRMCWLLDQYSSLVQRDPWWGIRTAQAILGGDDDTLSSTFRQMLHKAEVIEGIILEIFITLATWFVMTIVMFLEVVWLLVPVTVLFMVYYFVPWSCPRILIRNDRLFKAILSRMVKKTPIKNVKRKVETIRQKVEKEDEAFWQNNEWPEGICDLR